MLMPGVYPNQKGEYSIDSLEPRISLDYVDIHQEIVMQLPDESISYVYQSALMPAQAEWGPANELRTQHYVEGNELRGLVPQLLKVRSQVAAERELRDVPADLQPLDAGFIDLPQAMLDGHRRQGDKSDLCRVLAQAARLRELVDRVIVL